MIRYGNVTFAYPNRPPLLRDLTLELEPALTHALIGPSGCGKTTLLYLAAGLYAPSAGTVTVAGKAVSPGRRETAVILQDHGLFPWKTVRANLELGLRLRGAKREERRALAEKALADTAMAGHDRKFPKQLSGGERQRLAIARALVLAPDLLLLDEPFSALDAMTRERLQNRLAELAAAGNGLTVLLVTHDLAEAAFLADRIHVMGRTPAGDVRVRSLENPLLAEIPPAERRASPRFLEACARIRTVLEGTFLEETLVGEAP